MDPAVGASGLSSEWLSSALDRSVRMVSCEPVGTGQTAATYRLELDADPEGPSTMIAKVAEGDAAARKRVRAGVRTEVGSYASLLATVDVRAPHCWYAAMSEDALQFTLLLEDLAPRVPGVQVDGCTPVQALAALRNLAGLHAPRWNDESLFELTFLQRPSAKTSALLGGLTVSATEVFVERYGADLGSSDVDTLRAAAAAVERWLFARPEPFAVVHGDYRLDNLMFDLEGQDVVAVDWATVGIGLPARDVAYFLGTCLSVDRRRATEAQLIGAYHSALIDRGVARYSLDRCFEDYRLGQLQGPMITTIGAAYATAERSETADAMFLAMARRSCAAIRDLDSLALL